MIRLIYKLMRDKLLFALTIVALAVAIFDLGVIIFDIVELSVVFENSAKISDFFFGMNLLSIILSIFCVFFIIFYIIFKNKKISSKNEVTKTK